MKKNNKVTNKIITMCYGAKTINWSEDCTGANFQNSFLQFFFITRETLKRQKRQKLILSGLGNSKLSLRLYNTTKGSLGSDQNRFIR